MVRAKHANPLAFVRQVHLLELSEDEQVLDAGEVA
jgi:hypothetical protein